MAATVSVSSPARTAASRACAKCWAAKVPLAGSCAGTGVWQMADQAACSAATTHPLRGISCGCDGLGVVESLGPHLCALWGQVRDGQAQAVEGAVQDGVRDGVAPQRAGLDGVGSVVGQGADRTRGLPACLGIVQVGQCHGRGAHQGAVARPPGSGEVLVRAGGGRRGGRARS